MKGVRRFSTKDKLSLRYICPFEVLECLGVVAYRLAQPSKFYGLHIIFHMSMLKRYHDHSDYIITWDSIVLDKDL